MINKIILKYLLCFALIYSCQDNSKPNYQYMPNMYEAIGYDTYSESDAFSNGIEAQLPVDGSIAEDGNLMISLIQMRGTNLLKLG